MKTSIKNLHSIFITEQHQNLSKVKTKCFTSCLNQTLKKSQPSFSRVLPQRQTEHFEVGRDPNLRGGCVSRCDFRSSLLIKINKIYS